MGRRRALVAVLAAGSALAAACALPPSRPVVAPRPAGEPLLLNGPVVALPAAEPAADPTTVATVAPRPRPAAIPSDSYAAEPVVEIGTVEIPAIGLVHRIYQGVTLHNIDRGPSHWPGTALPGQPGNTVFAGHRVTNSHPFRDLDDLVAGDEVVFTVGGVRSVYQVTGSLVVEPRDTWIAEQGPTATGTLYACHPPGSLAFRFVVRLALA